MKRRLRNKSFKSRVKTTVKSFKSAIEKKDVLAKNILKTIFSLMDKGVKKKIFKKNKANKVKSSLSKKIDF